MTIPLRCLRCDAVAVRRPDIVQCSRCDARWPVTGGVPSYASTKEAGEVSEGEMASLVSEAQTDHWRTAIQRRFQKAYPEQFRYVVDLNRADRKSTRLNSS